MVFSPGHPTRLGPALRDTSTGRRFNRSRFGFDSVKRFNYAMYTVYVYIVYRAIKQSILLFLVLKFKILGTVIYYSYLFIVFLLTGSLRQQSDMSAGDGQDLPALPVTSVTFNHSDVSVTFGTRKHVPFRKNRKSSVGETEKPVPPHVAQLQIQIHCHRLQEEQACLSRVGARDVKRGKHLRFNESFNVNNQHISTSYTH